MGDLLGKIDDKMKYDNCPKKINSKKTFKGDKI